MARDKVRALGTGLPLLYLTSTVPADPERGDNDRVVDLRVDDHPEPIKELIRIRDLHTLYFGETRAEDVVVVDGDLRTDVAASLQRLGYLEEAPAERTRPCSTL